MEWQQRSDFASIYTSEGLMKESMAVFTVFGLVSRIFPPSYWQGDQFQRLKAAGSSLLADLLQSAGRRLTLMSLEIN
jgi:hypothetical protein